MDLRSLKRRELQALCKKHKIPANLSNLEMAKRLADFFEEKGQVNEQEENVSEIESIDVVRDRVVKKVRFSPEHELIEFTRSHGINQRHRRSFASVKESVSSVEHGDIGHMGSQCVNGNGRVTRSRGSTLMEGQQVNEKKRGRKGVKCNEQINNGSVVESVNEDKLGEGNAESSRRVLRTRRHKLAEDVENAQKVGKPKNKMGNGKALDDASDEKSVKENVEGPGRLARSKRQKLSGASGKNTVIVERVAETIGNSVLLDSAELDDDKVVTRCFSRKRGVMAGCEDMKTDGKNGDEILENRKMSEAQNMIEPQILLRRSRRNVDKVGASVGEIRMAEPIKPEVRRSKRRESVIPPHENARNSELTVETKKTKQPRSSAPQLVIAGRVSKNEKEVPQPSEVMRRSRRKVVETCETENHLTEEYPMENGSSSVEKNMGRSRRIASISNSVGIKDDTSKGPVIPQKNEARKRKKGPSLEAGAVKTTKPRSRKLPVKESRNEKTVSILENQLCSPDGADSMRDSSSRGEMINTNMTSRVSQMSGRSTRIEKSSAGSAKNSHVEISDGNKSANSKDSGKQTSASNIKDNAEKFDSLECDVIIEKTATIMERNQSEAQLSSQIKGSSCLNMTSGQMLQEGSIVSRNEGYVEISPSTDNVLLRNQTDVNNSLEVIEAEADKHTTPGSVVVDHAGEVEGIYVEKNLESFGNGEMNLISPPNAYLEDNKQHIDASNRSYKSNNEDGSSKAGEVGPSDSCVSGRCIDHIQSKLAIQVKDPSSSKSRSIESNHAETEKSGCLQGNLTAEIEDDEFSVSHLFGSERSATINLEDGGIGSGEFSAMESDERDIDKESLVVSPMTTCVELPSICIQRDVEADHTAKTDDVGSPNSHNRKCNEDKEVIISDILCVERRDTILPQDGDIICNEMSIGESVDKGHENELSGCEAKADQIAEGDEPCLCKDNQSEPAENNDGGCLENNKYERDDGFEFRLSTLFDSGKIVRDTPQARGIMPVEQVVLDEVPVASTTMNEVKINSGCLSLKEIDPQPISSSLSLGSGQIISEPCEIIDKEADCALVLEEGVCSLGNNICGDELLVHEKSICDRNPEIGSPPDAHTMEYIPKIEEQLKGLPVVPTAINETNEDAVNDEIFGYTKDVAADACVANDGTASKLLAESVCEMEFHHAENTAKTDYGGSPNSHNKKCDEEFVISDILGVERKDMILPQDGDIIYDEMSIEDSDDKGLEIELIGCEAEADQIAEGDEPCVCKDNQSEPAENGRCLANNKYERDDNWEFGLSSLFDSGKNVTDTPQARGIMFVDRMVLDEVPAASTTIDEVKINSGSLSLKEIGPQPISSSVSPGSGQIISEPCEIIDKESDCALILEKGVCSFGNNICGDEMSVHEKSVCDTNPEIVGPRDAHTKEYMPKREQQLKSLPVVPTAINETNEGDARVANDATPSKLLAESVCELEFHQAENTEQQSENLHENHTISDVGEKPSDVVSTSQRWAEIKLANLFETTPSGSYDTAPQGTERPNIILCTSKYDAKHGDRLANGEKEMEGERGSELVNTTYENAFLPTMPTEVSNVDRGFGVDSEVNQLQLLFATPIKTECPSMVDKTCSRKKSLDGADVLSTECVSTTEEDAAAQSIQDDKTRVAETQLEHSFCFGSSSGDAEEINNKVINEVECVGFVNTSTVFLSDATERHLIEDASFLYEEATGNRCQLTEINTLCLSGPPKNLDKLEGGKEMLSCTDLSENDSNTINVCPQSLGKTAQSNGAQFESPNVNNQKSNLLENSLDATAGFEDSILSERLSGTFKDLPSVEAANVGSYNGNSPSLITKASDEDDKVTEAKPEKVDDENDVPYEAKMMSHRDDNFRPSDHSFKKPHRKTEVDSLRSPSVSNNSLELDSTCKETGTITQNKDNVLPAAEQGCSVSGAKVDEFSSFAMHLLFGDDENGDCDKSEARMPIPIFEGDIEEKDKEEEKNSISMEVQLSSSEFQLEEGENSNAENRNVSHEVTDTENGDIEKSGVGTPLLNREADDVKSNKEVEKSPAAEAVQLEKQSVCSKNAASLSTCNERLKESDVVDTIEEYIGSELAWINEALCEDGSHKDESFETGSKELEEAISVDVHLGGYSADELAVEKEGEEQTKDLSLKESCIRKETVENFPAIVPLGGNSGSGMNNEMSPLKVEIESTKNLRTILIHGTPSKVPKTADMKENAPTHKNSVLGDLTAVRPAKRKALQDVNWK